METSVFTLMAYMALLLSTNSLVQIDREQTV
jgi:hypothetical protein